MQQKYLGEELSIPEGHSGADPYRQCVQTRRILCRCGAGGAEIGAKVLWLQQGIISEEAAAIAEKSGMIAIMDRIKVEDSIALGGR